MYQIEIKKSAQKELSQISSPYNKSCRSHRWSCVRSSASGS